MKKVQKTVIELGNFDENIPGELEPQEKDDMPAASTYVPMPTANKISIDQDKLNELLELSIEWKNKANTSNKRLAEIKTDIDEVMSNITMLLEITGLNTLIGNDKINKIEMISKTARVIGMLYRQKDDPDAPIKQIGSSFMNFIQKYASEQFITDIKTSS